MNQYLDIFIEESKENIQRINDHLLALEKDPFSLNRITEVFRATHTLKGMAAAMEFQHLAILTHSMESVLDAMRSQAILITPQSIDVLLNAVNDLESILMNIAEGGHRKLDIDATLRQLELIEQRGSSPGGSINEPVSESQTTSFPENEFEAAALEKIDPPETTRVSGPFFQSQTKTDTSIRVKKDRLSKLSQVADRLEREKGKLNQIAELTNDKELQAVVERVLTCSTELKQLTSELRKVPVGQVFDRFPRMVRQLARNLGKNIKLEVSGTEVEIDKSITDTIGIPIVHLLRNAIDHGIEQPEERERMGKKEEGTLTLRAYKETSYIYIEITDDGAGIRRDEVVRKAINRDLVSENEAYRMKDSQLFHLMMSSGFSTADKVSDVSGRGVGLDIVKNTIESLGGQIDITSQMGVGSTFLIRLPLGNEGKAAIT
ncbi:chemotaxis protein CheA [Thalassobacillus devorans]|uniref:chemotaxis protein CheA n=1 Tax=Thalassobacillus devorans TaxID=279813 RepID=UPI000A1CF288|nr:ATP-binding protein [Thalassobacillus devorans]